MGKLSWSIFKAEQLQNVFWSIFNRMETYRTYLHSPTHSSVAGRHAQFNYDCYLASRDKYLSNNLEQLLNVQNQNVAQYLLSVKLQLTASIVAHWLLFRFKWCGLITSWYSCPTLCDGIFRIISTHKHIRGRDSTFLHKKSQSAQIIHFGFSNKIAPRICDLPRRQALVILIGCYDDFTLANCYSSDAFNCGACWRSPSWLVGGPTQSSFSRFSRTPRLSPS